MSITSEISVNKSNIEEFQTHGVTPLLTFQPATRLKARGRFFLPSDEARISGLISSERQWT